MWEMVFPSRQITGLIFIAPFINQGGQKSEIFRQKNWRVIQKCFEKKVKSLTPWPLFLCVFFHEFNIIKLTNFIVFSRDFVQSLSPQPFSKFLKYYLAIFFPPEGPSIWRQKASLYRCSLSSWAMISHWRSFLRVMALPAEPNGTQFVACQTLAELREPGTSNLLQTYLKKRKVHWKVGAI